MSMLLETANQIHQIHSLSPFSGGSHASTIYSAAGEYKAPEIEWNPSEEMQKGARKVAFFLGVIWLFFLLGQHAIPGKSNGGMMGRNSGGGKFFAVGFLIILLLDLSLVPTVVNYILKAAWWVGSLFGLTDSDAGIG